MHTEGNENKISKLSCRSLDVKSIPEDTFWAKSILWDTFCQLSLRELRRFKGGWLKAEYAFQPTDTSAQNSLRSTEGKTFRESGS